MIDFKEGQIVVRNQRNFPECHGETGVITFVGNDFGEDFIAIKWDSDKVTSIFGSDRSEFIDILEVHFDENDAVK